MRCLMQREVRRAAPVPQRTRHQRWPKKPILLRILTTLPATSSLARHPSLITLKISRRTPRHPQPKQPIQLQRPRQCTRLRVQRKLPDRLLRRKQIAGMRMQRLVQPRLLRFRARHQQPQRLRNRQARKLFRARPPPRLEHLSWWNLRLRRLPRTSHWQTTYPSSPSLTAEAFMRQQALAILTKTKTHQWNRWEARKAANFIFPHMAFPRINTDG